MILAGETGPTPSVHLVGDYSSARIFAWFPRMFDYSLYVSVYLLQGNAVAYFMSLRHQHAVHAIRSGPGFSWCLDDSIAKMVQELSPGVLPSQTIGSRRLHTQGVIFSDSQNDIPSSRNGTESRETPEVCRLDSPCIQTHVGGICFRVTR